MRLFWCIVFFVKVLFFLGGEDVFLYICRTKQLKALEKEIIHF
jgi:hypothetical protein